MSTFKFRWVRWLPWAMEILMIHAEYEPWSVQLQSTAANRPVVQSPKRLHGGHVSWRLGYIWQMHCGNISLPLSKLPSFLHQRIRILGHLFHIIKLFSKKSEPINLLPAVDVHYSKLCFSSTNLTEKRHISCFLLKQNFETVQLQWMANTFPDICL